MKYIISLILSLIVFVDWWSYHYRYPCIPLLYYCFEHCGAHFTLRQVRIHLFPLPSLSSYSSLPHLFLTSSFPLPLLSLFPSSSLPLASTPLPLPFSSPPYPLSFPYPSPYPLLLSPLPSPLPPLPLSPSLTRPALQRRDDTIRSQLVD